MEKRKYKHRYTEKNKKKNNQSYCSNRAQLEKDGQTRALQLWRDID